MDDRVRVLHVDDDRGFADLVAEMLERENNRLEVVTATAAEAGLKRLRRDGEPIDCVVSDYEMPGTDGIEFLESVRADRPDLPFVLFTGKGSEAVASDAISAGATDYLRKRTGSEQYELLANRILNAVEQNRARKVAKRTQRRLREIADTSVDCLWMFTSEWDELLFVSGYEEVWGRSAESLRENPQDFIDSVHADDRASVRAAMERLSTGERVDIEYRIRTDDGLKWVWIEGEPIRDAGEETTRVVGFARDVTERKRREKALRRERDFVEQALNTLDDVFYVLDTDGTVRRWNDRLTEVTGRSDAEIDGIDATELFAPADRETVSRAIDAAFDGAEAPIEAALRTPDGTVPYEFTGKRLTGPDGGLVGLAGIGRDLTERHERERELTETNMKLRALGEAFPDLAFVVGVDGQYLEAFAGPETESLLYDGPEPYEAGTQHVRDVFDDDQADRVLETLQRAADTGEIQSIEYELDLESGRRWFEGRIAPVDGPIDGREAVVWVVRDTTDRKERERQFQALLDNTASLVYLKSPDGVYRRVNEASAANVETPPAALEGSHVSEVFDEAETIESRAADRRVLESGERVVNEVVRTIDGEERTFLSEKFPYRDADGEIIGVMGISRDITDRKERERELRRQNERLEEFAAIVSHDLRNPLQVAAGRLELARDEHESEDLDAAADAIDRSRTLVDDLATLTREGTTRSDPEPVDLASAARECWAHVDADAARLVVDADRVVLALPGGLDRLLENLLRNSVEHGSTSPHSNARGDGIEHGVADGRGPPDSPGGQEHSGPESEDSGDNAAPTLTVTVGLLKNGFYVEDDGRGIDPDDRETVFDPGYSTSETGTGFGLRIVEQVADAQGWSVQATEGTDGGARFEVTGVEFTE